MEYQKAIERLTNEGFAVIENFLTEQEVNSLLNECRSIVQTAKEEHTKSIFKPSTLEQRFGKYFLESGDKISFFYESKAFNEKGELVLSNENSLNKIGHALHCLNPVYKDVTFSQKVKDVIKQLGFIDPVVPQSMIIFKNPGVSSEVPPHQDASYLHTSPQVKLVGLWLALDDVTLENGCLSFIPKSHNGKLFTRFVRSAKNPEVLIYTKSVPEFDESSFVPVPVKKGSCVLIDGFVVHKSTANNTEKPRPVYTFHVYDQNNCTWSADNWLQPTKNLPFPHLFN